ncbi:MAG: hypothetical protein ACRC11_08140 [Xenococcaceae cyanobacterium]
MKIKVITEELSADQVAMMILVTRIQKQAQEQGVKAEEIMKEEIKNHLETFLINPELLKDGIYCMKCQIDELIIEYMRARGAILIEEEIN